MIKNISLPITLFFLILFQGSCAVYINIQPSKAILEDSSLNRYVLKEKNFEEQLQDNPESASLHLQRAQNLSEWSGYQLDLAESEFLASRSIDSNEKSLLGLTEIYIQKGELKKAEDLLKEAIQVNPQNPDIIFKLGVIYYRESSTVEALQLFETLLEYETFQPLANYYLGLIYEDKNMWEKALEYFKQVPKENSYYNSAVNEINQISSIGVFNIDELEDLELKERILKAPEPAEYPEAGAAILLYEIQREITEDGNDLVKYHKLVKIFNERGKKKYGEISISFDDTYETVKVEKVRVFKADGSIINVSKKYIKEVTPWAGFPLYSNYKNMIISLPEIAENVIIEYLVEVRGIHLMEGEHFQGQVWLQNTEPYLEQKYTLIVPSDKDLKFQYYQTEIKPEIQNLNNKIKYYWELGPQKEIITEPYMPPLSEFVPQILYSSFTDWQDFYDFWQKQIEDSFSISNEIKQEVKNLISNKNTSEEKAAAIYDFVSTKIRYVALEYGEGGFKPHLASEVFANKYGDCKDQAILLVAMLREAGLQAYPVLIKASGQDIFLDFAMSQFDHAIAVLEINSKLIFLDATSDVCPYGELPSPDQDRKVIVFKEDHFSFEKTPLTEAEHNLIKLQENISLQPDLSIKAEKIRNYYGSNVSSVKWWLKNTQPIKIKENLQESLTADYPGAQLLEYKVPNLEEIKNAAEISTIFTAPDFIKPSGDNEFLLPIPEIEIDTSPVGKDKRNFDLEFSEKEGYDYQITFILPDQFSVKYLPENYHEDIGYASIDYKLELEANKIKLKFNYYLKEIRIPQKDYPIFKNFLENIARIMEKSIILRVSDN